MEKKRERRVEKREKAIIKWEEGKRDEKRGVEKKREKAIVK